MDKKEIIYELAKGVQTIEFESAARYGSVRRKLTGNNISEIGLYSVIAEYLEENDISPHRFVKETAYAFRKVSENPFAIRTDKELSYLYHRFDSIKTNELDSKKFLCNKCFSILSNALKSSGKNYPHTCGQCRKKESNKHYVPKKDRNDDKPSKSNKVTESKLMNDNNEEKLITQEELDMLTSNPEDNIFEPVEEQIKPIGINIDTISGDGETTIISVMVPTGRLADYLALIKDHLDK